MAILVRLTTGCPFGHSINGFWPPFFCPFFQRSNKGSHQLAQQSSLSSARSQRHLMSLYTGPSS